MSRSGQCFKQYTFKEVAPRPPVPSVPPSPPHPSTLPQMLQTAESTGHSPRGYCGSVKAGLKLPLKSLSRHYFWIGDLDLGQLYSVCIIIGLAYIRETRNAENSQRPVKIINTIRKRRTVRLMTDSLRIFSQSSTSDVTAGKLSFFFCLV